MAAAIVTAGFAFAHFFRRGQATQFNRLAHVTVDGLLRVVQFLLRLQKSARDGVAAERLALLFEIGNLIARERLGLLLLLLQRLSLGHEGFVLAARPVIRDERTDALAG